MSERKVFLTKEELIEKYNLNEEEQVYLLPLLMEAEETVRRQVAGTI
ncbi:MAG: hypothetical protein GX893_01115 [Firmicutes bacterium]|jgi:hypothetical protein|nr:hypothetical protein [Bacillota bacterium]